MLHRRSEEPRMLSTRRVARPGEGGFMLEQSPCSVTHPQIAGGTCPHCGLLVATAPDASTAGDGAAGGGWNTARMLEGSRPRRRGKPADDHLQPFRSSPAAGGALPVVRKAFHDRAQRVRDRALTATVPLATSTEEHVLVETCESLLRTKTPPISRHPRPSLLLYYREARSDTHREPRHALILRVIEDMPDVPRSLSCP